MAVLLDHMTVYTKDKLASAEFYARVFSARRQELRRDFAPVEVSEGLTLNLEESTTFQPGHYAFRVTASEFSAIRERLQEADIPYGSQSRNLDGQVYAKGGVQGFYFSDPNGHGLEVITRE
jgi:catechol 2,3-dioxygenase-like lactoylglutathione lyase family enzyme